MRSEQGSHCLSLYFMKISPLDPKNILLRYQRVVKMHLFFTRKKDGGVKFFIGYPYTAGYGGIQEYWCLSLLLHTGSRTIFIHDGDANPRDSKSRKLKWRTQTVGASKVVIVSTMLSCSHGATLKTSSPLL